MENKAEHNIRILVADASHEKYVDEILDTIREAAKKRMLCSALFSIQYFIIFILYCFRFRYRFRSLNVNL